MSTKVDVKVTADTKGATGQMQQFFTGLSANLSQVSGAFKSLFLASGSEGVAFLNTLDATAKAFDAMAKTQAPKLNELQTQLKAFETNLVTARDKWQTLGENISKTGTEYANSAIKNISDSIVNSIEGVKTMGNAWTKAGDLALRAITQMATQYIASKLAMLAVDKFVRGENKAEAAGDAMTNAAPALMKSGAMGGWYGVLLYMAVFAAALGALSAMTSGFAEGGLVAGPGTGTSDSISARLSNGEFVMPAMRVNQFGPGFFEGIRTGDLKPMDLAGVRSGSNGSAGSQTNIHFAGIHDNEGAALKALESQRGQKWLIDFNKRTAHQVTGRG